MVQVFVPVPIHESIFEDFLPMYHTNTYQYFQFRCGHLWRMYSQPVEYRTNCWQTIHLLFFARGCIPGTFNDQASPFDF